MDANSFNNNFINLEPANRQTQMDTIAILGRRTPNKGREVVVVADDGLASYYPNVRSAAAAQGLSRARVYKLVNSSGKPDTSGQCWFYKCHWQRLNLQVEWRVYPGNDAYEVSSDGQVRLIGS